MTTIARAAAILLTFGLFTVGSVPVAGHAFPGGWHVTAHLAAYALIAVAFSAGWSEWAAVYPVLLVAVIGASHEITEILTHSHAVETTDIVINAIGAFAGVAIQRVIWGRDSMDVDRKGHAVLR
jgi:hypothetical protein